MEIKEKKYQNAWDLRPRNKFCIDCKWCESHGQYQKEADFGKCRINPPSPQFPYVHASDWCGKFVQSARALVEEQEIAAEAQETP